MMLILADHPFSLVEHFTYLEGFLLLVGVLSTLGTAIIAAFKFIIFAKATITKLDTVSDNISKINKELSDNGGSSLKDAINALRYDISYIHALQNNYINEINKQLFIVDQHGEIIFCTEKTLEFIGLKRDEVCNRGWKRAIYHKGKEAFVESWENAIKHHVVFSETCIIDSHDQLHYVKIEMDPVFIKNGLVCTGWLGKLQIIESKPKHPPVDVSDGVVV